MAQAPASQTANRPLEAEALRLLTVIHQLGEPSSDGSRRLVGESTLLQLDHLVRHPPLLAHLLIHLYDTDDSWIERRLAVSRQVRQLLSLDASRSAAPRPKGLPESHLDFPPQARWRRLDDALALASSRGLLEVGVSDGAPRPELHYEVTPAGADLLENRVFTDGPETPRHLEICGVIREFLPQW
ncbi:MAG: hypothetical protein AAF725_24700, partial [Acidobacteriota bacterium]